MPKFVIPKNTKLIKKADIEMIRTLGSVIKNKKIGLSTSSSRRYDEAYTPLEEFGFAETRQVLVHADKASIAKLKKHYQKHMALFTKAHALLAAGKYLAAAELVRNTQLGYGPNPPAMATRWFPTKAGELFYRDVTVVLGSD